MATNEGGGTDQPGSAGGRPDWGLRHDVSRRAVLKSGALGVSAVALGSILAACGGGSGKRATNSTGAQASAPADLNAARKEGTLVLWHGDQVTQVQSFLSHFTEKTGIKATQVDLNPGQALPKLQLESKSGVADVDVYNCADIGVLYQLREQQLIMRYLSKQIDAYTETYRSTPAGYWTTYYIDPQPMMYVPTLVSPSIAPKTFTDLLDSRWRSGIGFETPTSGDQYTWWYLLRNLLPSDFFDKLAAQKPTGYSSTTTLMQDLYNGNKKIGGKVGSFQYATYKKQGQPISAVYPTIGTPSVNTSTAIISTTKRPNAAKAFVDYLLSQEGQQLWNDIQGSYSARSDVTQKYLPPLSSLKLLTVQPDELTAYASTKTHQQFTTLWTKVVGLE